MKYRGGIFIIGIMAVGVSFTAMAATKSKSVISTGTNVAAATKNVIADNDCQSKYNACMDMFCMIDNDNGGRCQCSNKKSELDKKLGEIDALVSRAETLNTIGVDAIKSTVANVAAENAAAARDKKSETRDRLNAMFDALNATGDDDTEYETPDELAELSGAQLLSAAHNICVTRIGDECKSQLTLVQALYSQSVRSDCAAYENALAAKKNESSASVTMAQSNLRKAAMEQYQTANKYDLGQCAVEFQNCMMTTAGCGSDFTGCVGTVAADNMYGAVGQTYKIKGSKTQISIAKTTFEVLDAKRPMCDRVLQSCVNVADQVWDTFLRAAAPTIKTAELRAESNLRQSCMGNIAECIQNACRDNIDPNNPNSYDLCLSRPESVQSLCKPQIDPCVAAEPDIMDYVYMRLGAMRVNSCTTELKECLTDPDRCGDDYTQCIGLDTNTIIRMCPYEKLIGCQKQYGVENIRDDAIYDELSNVVQGIMLNIDNSLLDVCQNAVDDAMVKICGDKSTCTGFLVGDEFGGEYLNYRICPYYVPNEQTFAIDYDNCKANVAALSDGDLAKTPVNGGLTGVIDGMMYWGSIEVDDTGRITNIDKYIAAIGGDKLTDDQRDRARLQLEVIQNKIDSAVGLIENEPIIQWCRDGRVVPGFKRPDGFTETPRYPHITDQVRIRVANSLMDVARDNYQNKYNNLMGQMTRDYSELGRRITELDTALTDAQRKNMRRETAQRSCLALADMTILPKSPTPPTGNPTKWIIMAIAIAAAIAAIVFTAGAATGAFAAMALTVMTSGGAVSVAGGGAIVAAAVTGTVAVTGAATLAAGELGANSKEIKTRSGDIELPLTHTAKMEQWNYRDTVTVTFDPDSFICMKCTVTQECAKHDNPVFGDRGCKKWKDETPEKCEEIQL